MVKIIHLKTLNIRTRTIYQKECKKFRKNFYFLYGIYPEYSDPEKIQFYIDQCYPGLIKHSSVFKVHFAAVRKWLSLQNFSDCSLKAPRLDPSPLKILTVAQVKSIFSESKNHPCSLMLRLIYESGIRLQEVTQILIRDLDFEKMSLTLRGDHNTTRQAMIPEAIKYDLMRLVHKRSENEFVFSLRILGNGAAAPVSRRTLQQFLNRLSERAGIGRINTQTLRDSYAVHMIQKGYSLRLIMRIMGLKNIRSMQKYLRYADSSIKESPVLRSPLHE